MPPVQRGARAERLHPAVVEGFRDGRLGEALEAPPVHGLRAEERALVRLLGVRARAAGYPGAGGG